MPRRELREVSHVDDFRRLATENDFPDIASSRSDDAGDVACDVSTVTSDVEAGGVRVRTVDHNARRETDYVVVVHGTFDAPPADGARTWYQPPAPGEKNFCAKMGALLARGPIGAGSVWRAIPRATDSQGAESQGAASHDDVAEAHERGSQGGQSQGAASQMGQMQGDAASQEGGQSWQRMMDGDVPYPFFWDGSNTHEARLKAAEKLARLFDLIARSDPSARIHVIAHSHGGNVLLKAIELYMKRLPTKSLSSLHPAIRKRFSAAYKRRFDMVKEWRQVDYPSGWSRFFPPLVAMRSMTGGKVSNRIKEQYPWGRYRWLDSLLGLPVKRQRLFLSHRLATSPLSNALGCLVFLGTPFYVKKWERNGVRWLLLATVASIVVMLAVMWGYAMLVSFAIRSAIARESVHAPYVAPMIASALILVFATISVSIEVSRSTAFYSGNIYHSPDFDWSHAMSALVVHAGKLDEASLALSSEPIARAYVFPHLENMLKLPFWKPLPQFPPHDAVGLDWLLYFASFGRILLWNIIFILPALILSLLSHIVAPLVIGAVRNVIVVISFGLAQNELSFAHVFMDEVLDLGLSSQHVEHWNVQHLEHWNVQLVRGWVGTGVSPSPQAASETSQNLPQAAEKLVPGTCRRAAAGGLSTPAVIPIPRHQPPLQAKSRCRGGAFHTCCHPHTPPSAPPAGQDSLQGGGFPHLLSSSYPAISPPCWPSRAAGGGLSTPAVILIPRHQPPLLAKSRCRGGAFHTCCHPHTPPSAPPAGQVALQGGGFPHLLSSSYPAISPPCWPSRAAGGGLSTPAVILIPRHQPPLLAKSRCRGGAFHTCCHPHTPPSAPPAGQVALQGGGFPHLLSSSYPAISPPCWPSRAAGGALSTPAVILIPRHQPPLLAKSRCRGGAFHTCCHPHTPPSAPPAGQVALQGGGFPHLLSSSYPAISPPCWPSRAAGGGLSTPAVILIPRHQPPLLAKSRCRGGAFHTCFHPHTPPSAPPAGQYSLQGGLMAGYEDDT
ncbi:unnamed protein product, partial [Closterium sp. Naga37s-1]